MALETKVAAIRSAYDPATADYALALTVRTEENVRCWDIQSHGPWHGRTYTWKRSWNQVDTLIVRRGNLLTGASADITAVSHVVRTKDMQGSHEVKPDCN